MKTEKRLKKNTIIDNAICTSPGQPEFDNNNNNPSVSTNENNSSTVIGPRNVGKTFYMLKNMKK